MLSDRYHLAQRLLHWLIAIVVIGLLAAGLTLGTLGFEGARDRFGIETTNLIYKYHKSFGVVLLGLMALRLLLRAAYPPPPYYEPLPTHYRFAGRLNHFLLYALLLAQPVVGWAATAAGGFPIEFFEWTLPPVLEKNPPLSELLYGLHGVIGITLVVLIVLHASAALMHWRVRRDEVMHRMSLG